jgi:hypothetical protein
MRLREIAELLRETLPTMTYSSAPVGNNRWVTDYRGAVAGARRLQAAGVLKNDTTAMLSIREISDHVEDRITVSVDANNKFESAINRVKNRGTVLLETLDEMLEEEKPEQVAIQLPPDETTLASAAATMQELEMLLHQVVVNEYVQGEVRLVSFDRGTNWIEIYLGSTAAVGLIGAIVRLIYDIRLKNVDIATRREVFRSIKLENDLAAAAEKALEAELSALIDKGGTHAAKAGGIPSTNHDMLERIKFVVGALGDLVNRGARIVPSLAAPLEQKSEFPEPKQIAAAMQQLTAPKKQLDARKVCPPQRSPGAPRQWAPSIQVFAVGFRFNASSWRRIAASSSVILSPTGFPICVCCT